MTADQARLYEIDIQFELDVPNFPEGRVKEAISFVLSRHEVEEGTALSLVVTDSERVRALNSQYRGVDAPTDVLSFSADPLPDNLIEEMEDESSYLGDLIVAYPYTAHQAERDGH